MDCVYENLGFAVDASERLLHGGQGQYFGEGTFIIHSCGFGGEKMDQGAMMRYLNEMMWFPSAYLGKNISFESIDTSSARVTLRNMDKSVTATMYFDDEGRLTNFMAPRYRDIGNGRFELENWSTPIREYGEFEGLRLPIKGAAVWNLREGDLEYIDATVTDLKYDPEGPY